MDHIREHFRGDTLAEHLGIELLEVSPGAAEARMPVGANLFNAAGSVHGGAIFSLADFAFAVASNSHGQVSVAMNAYISYVRPAVSGTLTARAEEVSLGNRVATYTVTVRDDEDQTVAIFQGMVYRKREEIPGAIEG